MTDQPLILAMDTATPMASVALTRGDVHGGSVVGSLEVAGSSSHSRKLLGAIDFLMNSVGIEWQDLDGIGVGLGPGSFTGLRIGMATAKGLAVAAGLHLYGVSSLDSLAVRCMGDLPLAGVLDARKKEVYYNTYRLDRAGVYRPCGEPRVGSPEECAASLTGNVVLAGDGAVQYRQRFLDLLGNRVQFVPSMLNNPSAVGLGLLCGEQHCQGRRLDVGRVVPTYIRRSDAELNLMKKTANQQP